MKLNMSRIIGPMSPQGFNKGRHNKRQGHEELHPFANR